MAFIRDSFCSAVFFSVFSSTVVYNSNAFAAVHNAKVDFCARSSCLTGGVLIDYSYFLCLCVRARVLFFCLM